MPAPDPNGHWTPHWRPAGGKLIACGAPHINGAWDSPARRCCTTDPARVKCPGCLAVAPVPNIATDPERSST